VKANSVPCTWHMCATQTVTSFVHFIGPSKCALTLPSRPARVKVPPLHRAVSQQPPSPPVGCRARPQAGESGLRPDPSLAKGDIAKLSGAAQGSYQFIPPDTNGEWQSQLICPNRQACRQPNSKAYGAPKTGHLARSGGTRYVFASPGLASSRRRPLSSLDIILNHPSHHPS
jgi:hypothetical protein